MTPEEIVRMERGFDPYRDSPDLPRVRQSSWLMGLAWGFAFVAAILFGTAMAWGV